MICDICDGHFAPEHCVDLDSQKRDPAVQGVTGREGRIEAAFFYCLRCWQAAVKVAAEVPLVAGSTGSLDTTKWVARQMVINRVRS